MGRQSKRGSTNSRGRPKQRGQINCDEVGGFQKSAYNREKFIAMQEANIPSKGIEFHPKTDNQKRLLRYLREGRKYVWAIGVFGSGKSMCAAYYAAEMLRQKKIEKIYLLRPNVSCGRSHGMIPGTLKEKLSVLFGQTIAHLSKFLGEGYTNYCLENDVIEMLSIEYLRGYSFENCVVIIEECQGLTEDQYEMLLSRCSSSAQLINTGDERQIDIADRSGLRNTIDMLTKAIKEKPDYLDDSDLEQLYQNIGVVEFTFDDVLRSDVVKALAKLYYYKD